DGGDARFAEHLGCARPLQANRDQPRSDVGELDIIHDDVALEQFAQVLRLGCVGFDQHVLPAIEAVKVGQNASLRVQQKTVGAVAELQIANVVRDHAVKPVHAMIASDYEFA